MSTKDNKFQTPHYFRTYVLNKWEVHSYPMNFRSTQGCVVWGKSMSSFDSIEASILLFFERRRVYLNLMGPIYKAHVQVVKYTLQVLERLPTQILWLKIVWLRATCG